CDLGGRCCFCAAKCSVYFQWSWSWGALCYYSRREQLFANGVGECGNEWNVCNNYDPAYGKCYVPRWTDDVYGRGNWEWPPPLSVAQEWQGYSRRDGEQPFTEQRQ